MTITSSKWNQCIHSKQQRPLLASPHRKRRCPITFTAWRLTKGLEISPDKTISLISNIKTLIIIIHQCQQGFTIFISVNKGYKGLPWSIMSFRLRLHSIRIKKVSTMTMGPSKWKRVTCVYFIHQCQQGLQVFTLFISVNKCLPCL